MGINKPSGLVVHASDQARFRRTCMKILRHRLQVERLYPANRLDRGTSGLMVIAKTKEAASNLGKLFQNGLVSKTYLALVRGWSPPSGIIDSPIDNKPTATEYKTLFRTEIDLPSPPHPTTRYSFMELKPDRGVFHQIRRHLRRLGHPIIGDTQHGSRYHNKAFYQRFKIKRMLLHAYRLKLPHPITGTPLELIAPLPGRIIGLLVALGIPEPLVRHYAQTPPEESIERPSRVNTYPKTAPTPPCTG